MYDGTYVLCNLFSTVQTESRPIRNDGFRRQLVQDITNLENTLQAHVGKDSPSLHGGLMALLFSLLNRYTFVPRAFDLNPEFSDSFRRMTDFASSPQSNDNCGMSFDDLLASLNMLRDAESGLNPGKISKSSPVEASSNRWKPSSGEFPLIDSSRKSASTGGKKRRAPRWVFPSTTALKHVRTNFVAMRKDGKPPQQLRKTKSLTQADVPPAYHDLLGLVSTPSSLLLTLTLTHLHLRVRTLALTF